MEIAQSSESRRSELFDRLFLKPKVSICQRMPSGLKAPARTI